MQQSARLAETLLQESRPERWLHTRAVAHRATELASTVAPADRPVLIAAAWLHDIGHALTIGPPDHPQQRTKHLRPTPYWIHLFRMTRQPFVSAIIKAPNDSTPQTGPERGWFSS